jgi:hypothetical protein
MADPLFDFCGCLLHLASLIWQLSCPTLYSLCKHLNYGLQSILFALQTMKRENKSAARFSTFSLSQRRVNFPGHGKFFNPMRTPQNGTVLADMPAPACISGSLNSANSYAAPASSRK